MVLDTVALAMGAMMDTVGGVVSGAGSVVAVAARDWLETRRADGLPRRPGHRLGPGPRRHDPGAGPAVPHGAVHERLSQPDRPRHPVPGRDPAAAAGRDSHGGREDHLVAG